MGSERTIVARIPAEDWLRCRRIAKHGAIGDAAPSTTAILREALRLGLDAIEERVGLQREPSRGTEERQG